MPITKAHLIFTVLGIFEIADIQNARPELGEWSFFDIGDAVFHDIVGCRIKRNAFAIITFGSILYEVIGQGIEGYAVAIIALFSGLMTDLVGRHAVMYRISECRRM